MEKKTIVLGITGGIAAFKSAQLTSNLIKKGYDVEVIMSEHATQFITPLTFESLTKHNVMVSTFEKVADRSVKHISIAQRADIFVIVPATANIIAKCAYGLADDMLTTTFLASSCPKIICPAMNTGMYENPLTQRNIAILKEVGMQIVEPESGYLACGDIGKGKLADIAIIEDAIEMALCKDKSLQDKHVLITAGPTLEALDPVRFISNHSSGKMGYALARVAKAMGAQVTLISGPSKQAIPYGVTYVPIKSAQEMFDAVKQRYESQDIIIKAAAVSDYRATSISEHKIKKQEDTMDISFCKNEDILAFLGAHKQDKQVLCGFAMETQHMIENATVKMIQKNCDMLVANNLKEEGAGFQNDTNVVTLIQKDAIKEYPCMKKEEVAQAILIELGKLLATKGK